MRDRRPDGWSRIGNFHISCTRVRTNAHWRPDEGIWIAILALCMSASERETTSSGWLYQSSLILNLERIWSWSITDRRPDGLLRCLDGCRLEQKLLDTVEGLDGKTRRPDGWCWSVECLNGMTRRLDGWNSGQMGVRTGWHIVWTANREPESFYLLRSAESSENALNSGIPVYNIFTHKWFCPNRMRPKY